MPAPTAVSSEQVAKAAAEITAQGRRVTGNTLRGVIGQGRPDRLFAVWQEQHGQAVLEAVPEPETPALPPAIADHLATATERLTHDLGQLVGQAWARAAELATQRVQAEVLAARARVVELEDDAVQGKKNLDSADERAEMLADELAQALAAAETAKAAEKGIEQKAREFAAGATAREAEAARQIAALRAELDEEKGRTREAEAAAAKAGQESAAASARAAAALVSAAREHDQATAARMGEQEARAARARADALAEAATARAEAAEARAVAAEERASSATREALDRLSAALAAPEAEDGAHLAAAPRRGRPPGRRAATDIDELSVS